ncbi:MAG: HU family DNA-binding protein [Clostridia bacterium]|nr:HU family DNA-binding protein [Clostridia bacterium]
MTKSQWIDAAAKESGMTKKQLNDAYDALAKVFGERIAEGESVQLSGFGTFSVRKREARTGRNPKTGETLQIPSTRRLVFLPAKTLKEKINEA